MIWVCCKIDFLGFLLICTNNQLFLAKNRQAKTHTDSCNQFNTTFTFVDRNFDWFMSSSIFSVGNVLFVFRLEELLGELEERIWQGRPSRWRRRCPCPDSTSWWRHWSSWWSERFCPGCGSSLDRWGSTCWTVLKDDEATSGRLFDWSLMKPEWIWRIPYENWIKFQ